MTDAASPASESASSTGRDASRRGTILVINGPNGNVQLAGTYGVNERTLTVRVNGTDFATVNLDGPDPVITGADGQPLGSDDEASLQAIVAFYLNSGGMLDGLSAL